MKRTGLAKVVYYGLPTIGIVGALAAMSGLVLAVTNTDERQIGFECAVARFDQTVLIVEYAQRTGQMPPPALHEPPVIDIWRWGRKVTHVCERR